jgi:hypothetical protein
LDVISKLHRTDPPARGHFNAEEGAGFQEAEKGPSNEKIKKGG